MSDKVFVGVHNHSFFSIGDSISSPDDMARKAKELGMNALSITDHGTLAGWLQFSDACKKYSIKPIYGVEAYFVDDVSSIHKVNQEIRDLKAEDKKLTKARKNEETHAKNNELVIQLEEYRKTLRYNHLILLARNWEGCSNLIRIHNAGVTDGYYYKPRVDWKVLESNRGGLIATSACLGGKLSRLVDSNDTEGAKRAVERFNGIFGKGNFYIEIQLNSEPMQKSVNLELIRLAEETDTPLCVTCDSHYIEKGQNKTRALIYDLGEADTSDNGRDLADLYIKNEDMLLKSWNEFMPGVDRKILAQAILNTRKISDCIEEFVFDTSLKFPMFETGNDDTQEEALTKLALHGLMSKGLHKDKRYIDRLKRELKTIHKLGFSPYFLVVGDIVNDARKIQPVGPARGSAAGSLVAYAVGITNVDPIRHELFFERFLDESKGLESPTFGLQIANLSVDYNKILQACECHV